MQSYWMNVSEKQITEFCQLVEQNQQVVGKVKDKDVVLLMGATGSGKSTTTNVLCGCKPVEKKIRTQTGHLKIVVDTLPENGIVPQAISHTDVSQTLIAGVLQDPSSGVMYVDAMGHKDNRGWEVALANAANLMSIVKCCRSLKVMVLIPAASVHTNRRESIVDMLQVLEQFFMKAGGLNAFQNSFLVLVTKARFMGDVICAKDIVHKVNNKLQVVGLSFEDKNRAKFLETKDEFELHPGTLEDLKHIIKNQIQAASFQNTQLQAPITNDDRQVLQKLQNILKNKVEKVGIDNIVQAIKVYNAFCFLEAIECEEVDMILKNMQDAFLAQFQHHTSNISQQLNQRNLKGALLIKNKLESAIQKIQNDSSKLYQFIKEQRVLETIKVYNAFCFLEAIECEEVDMMLKNIQDAFLAQFQHHTSNISQQLNQRNQKGALLIKNKLESAIQKIQNDSSKLYKFSKEQRWQTCDHLMSYVLETCDHLIQQVNQFEQELKAEKIAKENALREKQAEEQARKEAETQKRWAELERQNAEKLAAAEHENYLKASEAHKQELEKRHDEQLKHAAELVAIAERLQKEAELRAEQKRKEDKEREKEQRRRDEQQRQRDRQHQLQQRVANSESRSSGGSMSRFFDAILGI